MKVMKSMVFAATMLALSITGFAQKIKTREGDVKILKDVTEINVEFTYDHMSVGKFKDEADYIAKKKEEYNKKEAGRGDKWEKAWIDDRENTFEPKFIELFTDHSGMKINDKAKYTLIFHTTSTEPGFNVGVMRKNAYIDAEVLIVETANRNNVIAKITVDNAPGRDWGGYDFDTGYRISEAYAKAGKSLGKYIK